MLNVCRVLLRYLNILKVVSATFLPVCLLSLNDSTCETRKISLQKHFSFPRKKKFRILDFQISWRHQMPKTKTRNTFYWITWEVITVCKWNLVSLCNILKQIISSKLSTKTAAWKLVPGPFVLQRIKRNLY